MNIINQDDLVQVASISGGLSSHSMIPILVEKYGIDKVKFVYCDTGAEHPDTYKFIRDTVENFGIDLVCLRLDLPKERGKGARYDIVDYKDLKQDYKAFRSLMEKYGRPYMPSGKFCTDQMKTSIYRKYCDDTFGKGNYVSWIGYRADPRDSSRVWGHTISGTISKHLGIPQREQGEFYKDCRELFLESPDECYNFIEESIVNPSDENTDKRVKKIYDKVVKRYETNYRFLFEISDFEKADVKEWWDKQDFNLEIPPHCGNCIFCIEKSTNQLCYLVASQPEQANLWKIELDNSNIPYKDARKYGQKVIYRGALTFDDIIEMSKEHPLEVWEERMGVEQMLSPCASGECSVFGDGED